MRIKNKVLVISFVENYIYYDFKIIIYCCVFGKYLLIENEWIDNWKEYVLYEII